MSRIPDVIIERVHLGEATSAQKARVMADSDARARLEALDAQNSAFFEAHPAREMVGDIGRRVHVARTRDAVQRRRRRLALGASLLVPLAAAVLVSTQLDPSTLGPSQPTIGDERPKGGPKLHVYRKGRTGSRHIAKGTVLRERDVLQLAYQASDAKYGVVLSIDGRGAVTMHWPDDRNTRLYDEGRYTLPHAYKLDDAPDFERFLFVTSPNTPIDVDAVLSAAEQVAGQSDAQTRPLNLPRGLDQQDFTILKDVL